ncbi:hypothetical protein KUF71_010359 [Frankliniella fusca]|uniref:Uncharacterized protein n=1 Tax=Frankliniella fusca TaxID=407009 RepID=A0AAE1HGY8_9NEOP|nr:hypothetical protein KUF71_010359 [Frankliniella fusca]
MDRTTPVAVCGQREHASALRITDLTVIVSCSKLTIGKRPQLRWEICVLPLVPCASLVPIVTQLPEG